MKTEIIMIRHGESVTNRTGVFTGESDVALTDIGLEQAELAGVALRDEHIDVLYSSDLSRAFNTAVPVARSHGLEIIPDARLREIRAGLWEGMTFGDIAEQYPEEYKIWKTRLGAMVCPGGESIVGMCERVISAVAEIAERHPGEIVCIASHATPIRAICAVASGIPIGELEREPYLPNASISRFEYENGRFTLVKKGDVSHLEGKITRLPDTI